MSRGSPTFTDSSRAIALGIPPARILLAPSDCLSDGEFAIGAMRNHRLTRLKTKLPAIELYRDNVGLERHQAGNAADLGIGVTIRPCRQMCVTDIVVAAYPFVRAEGLVVHRSQCGLINIGTFNVPPRRKARLVEDHRPPRVGDDAVTIADDDATGSLPDVDAVVADGGMAQDALVFCVECVHGRPGERDPLPATRSRRGANRCAATPLAARSAHPHGRRTTTGPQVRVV